MPAYSSHAPADFPTSPRSAASPIASPPAPADSPPPARPAASPIARPAVPPLTATPCRPLHPRPQPALPPSIPPPLPPHPMTGTDLPCPQSGHGGEGIAPERQHAFDLS